MNTIVEMFEVGMDRPLTPPLPMKKHEGEIILNLGCGNKHISGTIPLDLPEWDADLEGIPYKDESIRGIHAYHFLEHTFNPVGMLKECQRVLKPGGLMNIVVPYYRSQFAYHDFDHRHYFTEDNWKILFNNPYYDKNKIAWKFEVITNIIIGIVERNICLMTQLRRTQ